MEILAIGKDVYVLTATEAELLPLAGPTATRADLKAGATLDLVTLGSHVSAIRSSRAQLQAAAATLRGAADDVEAGLPAFAVAAAGAGGGPGNGQGGGAA